LGRYEKVQPLHVACAVGQGFLWIITVYRPDMQKWHKDLKTRKV